MEKGARFKAAGGGILGKLTIVGLHRLMNCIARMVNQAKPRMRDDIIDVSEMRTDSGFYVLLKKYNVLCIVNRTNRTNDMCTKV